MVPEIFRWLLAALVGIACAAPLGARAQEQANPLCPSGVLVIGTDATFPPFSSKVGDNFVGLEIELGDALAKRLGCEAQWVNSSFDGIFPALLTGKYDFVLASVTITEERKKTMRFTDAYIDAGQAIAVRRGSPPIPDLPGLFGKRVGVGLNTTGQFLMEEHPEVSINKYPSVDLALADLKNKRLDAAVVDGPVLRYMIAEGFAELQVTGVPLNSEQWGMAVAPDRDALRAALNDALGGLKADGSFATLEARFLGAGTSGGPAPAVAGPDQGGGPGGAPEAEIEGMRFRGDRFVASIPLFFQGAKWTLGLSVLAFLCALPLGLAIALARMSRVAAVRWPAVAWVELLRGTPLLVQIFFIYFVLPAFGVTLGEVTTAVLALSVNASAYVAEIFRAGLESLDRGQTEAALALGLTRRQAFRYVLVPQAVRRVVPPLTNEAIALIKDSSLISVMGMTELTRTGQELASRYADPLTIWPGIALTYFLLTFPLTRLSSRLEARINAGRDRA